MRRADGSCLTPSELQRDFIYTGTLVCEEGTCKSLGDRQEALQGQTQFCEAASGGA